MFIDLSVALYGGGSVLQTLFPDIPLWVAIAALALLAGVYTIFGGLEAVVITDTIQGVVLMVGGTVVAILAFMAIPSWDAVQQATTEHSRARIGPHP